MDLTIRPLATPEDGRFIEQLTIAAWGSDPADVPPFHLSFTVAKENAGVVLLAFDGERPVGFCLGFWAFDEDEKRWHCASHMTGVLPQYKGRGLGEQIKWAQRAFVLDKGFHIMTWTYDPLETLNGWLNIRKLGAVCQTYLPNHYGELKDALNHGLPTDRFRVTWWLNSAWVAGRQKKAPDRYTMVFVKDHPHLALNQSDSGAAGFPLVVDLALQRVKLGEDLAYFAAVPRDFQAIKKNDPEGALRWRLATRTVFQTAFAAGYSVVDLIGEPEGTLCYYILEKNWHPDNVT